MSGQLFRRFTDFILQINGQQVRWMHKMRCKPVHLARTLEQRLQELNAKDPETSYRVDIGYKQSLLTQAATRSAWIAELNKIRRDPEMEKLSRNKELLIDLEKTKQEWWNLMGPNQIRTIADHYEIFQHLFGDAYFTPVLPIRVEYDFGNDIFAPVHRGNFMKPRDVKSVPLVSYDSTEDTLWTLLLTTPDGHFFNEKNELCHWFVGNIPGSELSKGDLLIDYMRPIPAYGIGYCRYVFVLYKQEERIDYSEYKKGQPCLRLADRDWNTLEFYRKYQDLITPASLAFFQSDWDSSVTDYYHKTLQTKEPKFEYDFPKPYVRPQEWFPLRRAFNLYLDRYRDPKDINKDFLVRKLKKVHPFRPPKPPLRFPNAVPLPNSMPSWLITEVKKERCGVGRVNEIN